MEGQGEDASHGTQVPHGVILPKFTDMMADQKRKALSRDPGWKYGFWPNVDDKNRVQCGLCGHVGNGGINRLKQHIIGGFSNVSKCLRSTAEIRDELRDFNDRNRKRKVDTGFVISDGASNIVNLEDDDTQPQDLARAAAKKKGALPFSSAKEKSDSASLDSQMTLSPWEVVAQRKAGKAPKTIEQAFKKDRAAVAHDCWAQFFYDAGIPYNAANRVSFEVAVEASIQAGKGYVPPSYHQLRKPLLDRQYAQVRELESEHRKHWKNYGCTLMSDGWSDKRRRSLINFMVNTPEGSFYLYSINASSVEHTSEYMFSVLDECIEKIGVENVVQVITDNASNYVSAGKTLMEKRPHLFWTPCAAHCLDLMLEDVAGLPKFAPVVKKARRLTSYIYTHTRLHDAFVSKSKGNTELMRPGITRFATSFLTLQSVLGHRDTLFALFNSESWRESKLAKTVKGHRVAAISHSRTFWNALQDLLRASQPLLQVLRLVDADEKPAMGYILAAMERAKSEIKENFANKERDYKPVVDIIEKRWTFQMSRPLYGAGYLLNPALYYEAKERRDPILGQCQSNFLECLVKMIEDLEEQDKIAMELDSYKDARGLFGNPLAIRHRTFKQPMAWWDTYGAQTPSLMNLAKRILGLCCTSSACERNWSTFDFIHTRRRNKLEVKNLDKLVYIQYNRQLNERFNKRRLQNSDASFDPIALDELNWNSEWMTGIPEDQDPEVVDGIRLSVVDEAMGASELDAGPVRPRQARTSRGNQVYSRRGRGASTSRPSTSQAAAARRRTFHYEDEDELGSEDDIDEDEDELIEDDVSDDDDHPFDF